MKKALIIVAVVALLGAIIAASVLKGDRKKGKKVYAEEAKRQDIAQIVKSSGQITPRVKVNISAHVIGKIEKLYIQEGDEIEQGQSFLDLEKESFVAVRDNAKAQLGIQRSQLRQAEIDLADAEVKLRRAKKLIEQGIFTDEQLEASELAVQSGDLQKDRAQEGVLQAEANLTKAEDDLAKTTIYSPLTGRVIELHAEEGEVVVSGTMNNAASIIGVVADLSEILTEVNVDETEIVDIRVGQSATVFVDALPDVEYIGHVVEIGSSGYSRPQQPDVTFFLVKVLLDDPDERLRPGMSARADIEITTHESSLVVPIQSVVQRKPIEEDASDEDGEADIDEDGEADIDEDGKSDLDDDAEEIEVVFVIDESDEAIQTPVETGISDATHIEILSGLEEGDRVVTGPYRAMKDLGHEDAVKVKKEGGDDEEED